MMILQSRRVRAGRRLWSHSGVVKKQSINNYGKVKMSNRVRQASSISAFRLPITGFCLHPSSLLLLFSVCWMR